MNAAAPATVVFVELGERIVAATLAAPEQSQDLRNLRSVAFPARIVAGARKATGETARRYQIGGGSVVVGAEAERPGPFIPRSGSTLPEPFAAAMEDGLLALHALCLLGVESYTAQLCLMVDDPGRAQLIADAVRRLGQMSEPAGALPMPSDIAVLGEDEHRRIALAARQPHEPAPQCLCRCLASGAHLQPIDLEAPVVRCAPIYGPFEGALLKAGSQKHLIDPARWLAPGSAGADEDGTVANALASATAHAVPLVQSALQLLKQDVRTFILVGEDSRLYNKIFRALGHSPVVHFTPASGYPTYAARSYLSGAVRLERSLDGSVAVSTPDVLSPHFRRRRRPVVQLSEDGHEVTLRIPMNLLDRDTAQLLRLFEASTQRSPDEGRFLMELLKVERR